MLETCLKAVLLRFVCLFVYLFPGYNTVSYQKEVETLYRNEITILGPKHLSKPVIGKYINKHRCLHEAKYSLEHMQEILL